MRTFSLFAFLHGFTLAAPAQTTEVELYDLVKSLMYDSTGYENVGDWAVDHPKKYPVKWASTNITMSNDTSINFFRVGTATVTVKGRTFKQANQPMKWNVMLKGARMGYSSFSILSFPSAEIQSKPTVDSLFGKKPFAEKLLKSCNAEILASYYYYEMKIPKKDKQFLKISWLSRNGNTALRIDGYDDWSKYAVKLDCKN